MQQNKQQQGRRTNAEPGRTDGLIIIKEKKMEKTSHPNDELSPQAELVRLTGVKGQTLTAKTLRIIRENLELRGCSLQGFVNIVRPHFKNRITNPSGFLIASCRNLRELSTAAVPLEVPQVAEAEVCADCGRPKGKGFQIVERRFVPCETCATPEWRAELEKANQNDNKR
jgi:hypothetical protein